MKAYISCPIPVALSALTEVANKLTRQGYEPSAWQRGTDYKDDQLKEASIFVLMSQGNRFDYTLDSMTAGCRKELALAKSLGKTLYMAYWKNGRDLNIYPINLKHLEDGRVLGQSGSYLRDADKVIENYSIF